MTSNHHSVGNTLCGRFAVLFAAVCGLASGGSQAAGATPAEAAKCPASLNYTLPRLQDEKPQSLCQYAGKVLVVVNTASYCGFTGQYKGLEALYDKYRARGLVVLGFPSNDFSQETGSNKEIADFCENTFGVKFPMFGKTEVRGKNATAFYQQLATATGKAPTWNFHKYVIARDGKVTAHFPSSTTPEDRAFLREIEKQLH